MPITNAVVTATSLPYIIYSLLERTTGRHYVGLTKRTLPARVSAHLSQARGAGRSVPAG